MGCGSSSTAHGVSGNEEMVGVMPSSSGPSSSPPPNGSSQPLPPSSTKAQTEAEVLPKSSADSDSDANTNREETNAAAAAADAAGAAGGDDATSDSSSSVAVPSTTQARPSSHRAPFTGDWKFPSSSAALHSSAIYSIRFHPDGLAYHHPPQWVQTNKKIVADKIAEVRSATQSTTLSSSPPHVRFTRYNSEDKEMDVENTLHKLVTAASPSSALTITRGVYSYAAPASGESHFYVDFGDDDMFHYYSTEVMAQEGGILSEHPILPSIREFLLREGSTDPKASTFIVNDKIPTPAIMMNIAREASLDMIGHDLYGAKFCAANQDQVLAAVTVLPTPTLSHIIAMSSLRHGDGRYLSTEIETTLKTAFTAFQGAKFEAIADAKENRAESKEEVRVVVHTGNWGCGAFGGNVELMCLLQVCAAELADVDIVYHAMSESNENEIRRAIETFERCKIKFKELEDEDERNLDGWSSIIEDIGYEWGVTND